MTSFSHKSQCRLIIVPSLISISPHVNSFAFAYVTNLLRRAFAVAIPCAVVPSPFGSNTSNHRIHLPESNIAAMLQLQCSVHRQERLQFFCVVDEPMLRLSAATEGVA